MFWTERDTTMFRKAVPVWHDEGLNTHLLFTVTLDDLADTVLRIAAADFYALYVDGAFLGWGPARTAAGYARVDEYRLAGGREIRLEVAGYGCSSLATVRQNSFCCAEVTRDGQVLAATGSNFTCLRRRDRLQKTERFSMQRHFTEVYEEGARPIAVEAVPVDAPVYLPRRVPYPDFTRHEVSDFRRGTFEPGEIRRKNAYTTSMLVEKNWGIFPEEEVVSTPFRFVASLTTRVQQTGSLPAALAGGECLLFDAGVIQAGFPLLQLQAHEDSTVLLAMSEDCPEDCFSFVPRMNCQPVIEYRLRAGQRMDRQAFEPYTFRRVLVLVREGRVTVTGFGWRDCVRDMRGARIPQPEEKELQNICEGACRSFAHNAVDLFTDCPSRERAGWLCDSFFTARAEYALFGSTEVEDAFLENFVLYQNKGEFPEGVLPMVYPADPHENNKFIPQWNMWYVLEVCEYLTERRPDADRAVFWPSVQGILTFLARWENEFGLLEDLPSWNFVEWSSANDWTKNVNYPTNLLYAGVLEAAGEAFGLDFTEKVRRIRREVLERAFDGEVFCDHAIRADGQLVNQPHVSEACQYYAALFGGIDLSEPRFCRLRRGIVQGFPERREFPDFCPVNAFIGMYLRMNVLANMGDRALLQDNIRAFFGGMCGKTGTLWEYKNPTNSLDHGFASYVLTLLDNR